jgi:hypothetical protein
MKKAMSAHRQHGGLIMRGLRKLICGTLLLISSAPAQVQPTNVPGAIPVPQIPGAIPLPPPFQIRNNIIRQCRGEPRCVAVNWGLFVYGRCQDGDMAACASPDMLWAQDMIASLPPHMRPRVILNNVRNDLRNGPGAGNEIFGRNGFVCGIIGCR